MSKGRVRDSTLEFKDVLHVTLIAVFVTYSKNIFTFSLTFTILILQNSFKPLKNVALESKFDVFTKGGILIF